MTDDEPLCPTCNGSGEGMYDGSRCSSCRGTGVESDGEDWYENQCAKADYENDLAREREADREWENRK